MRALRAGLLLAAAVLAGCAQDPAGGPPRTSPTGGAPATSPAPGAPPPERTPSAPASSPTSASSAAQPAPVAPVAPSAADVDDPASLAVVVNKRRPLLPRDWAPPALEEVEGQRLRPEAAGAARELLAAARADGVPIRLLSGYRSAAEQAAAYAHWVRVNGTEVADTVSARPGHSEHQTGLAVDVGDGSGCELRACFAGSPTAAWVAEHASRHGFVVRYPPGAQAVTGYVHEPWHLRYLGPRRAQEFARSGAATLEEFSGVGPAPDYGGARPRPPGPDTA